MNGKKIVNTAAAGILIGGSIVPNVGYHLSKESEVTAMAMNEPIHTPTTRVSRMNPRRFARDLLALRGYGSGQYRCLVRLWNRESRWNPQAYNHHSGAFGIPQRIRGKHDPLMLDYRGQIVWGVGYIRSRYGTPCHALNHQLRRGWY